MWFWKTVSVTGQMNIRERERGLKVLATGFHLCHAGQLSNDISLRSAVTSCGAPGTNAATVKGAALAQAIHVKEAKVCGTWWRTLTARRGDTGDRINSAPFSISRVEEKGERVSRARSFAIFRVVPWHTSTGQPLSDGLFAKAEPASFAQRVITHVDF